MDSQYFLAFSLSLLLIFSQISSFSFSVDPTRITQLSWTPRYVFCVSELRNHDLCSVVLKKVNFVVSSGHFYTKDFSQMRNVII